MTKIVSRKMMTMLLILTFGVHANAVLQDAQERDEDDERAVASSQAKQYVRELAAPNPVLRLRAAENLARVAALDERRIVEGYRLQEKDKRVQLALDWALYRFGDERKLFPLVAALDSTALRSQSISYLSRLDAPEPLYMFLNSPKRKVRTGIIGALGNVGDARTLTQLEPLARSRDNRISDAADDAVKRIKERLEAEAIDADDAAPSRPRQTGNRSDDAPPAIK